MFGPEPKDPGVFQEAADDGPHPNPLRESGHTGPQAAHAADDQVDLRSSLRGFVECIDNLRVNQAVHLENDPTTRLAPLPDQPDDTGTQTDGRDQQLAEAALPAVSGEEVEQL